MAIKVSLGFGGFLNAERDNFAPGVIDATSAPRTQRPNSSAFWLSLRP